MERIFRVNRGIRYLNKNHSTLFCLETDVRIYIYIYIHNTRNDRWVLFMLGRLELSDSRSLLPSKALTIPPSSRFLTFVRTSPASMMMMMKNIYRYRLLIWWVDVVVGFEEDCRMVGMVVLVALVHIRYMMVWMHFIEYAYEYVRAKRMNLHTQTHTHTIHHSAHSTRLHSSGNRM